MNLRCWTATARRQALLFGQKAKQVLYLRRRERKLDGKLISKNSEKKAPQFVLWMRVSRQFLVVLASKNIKSFTIKFVRVKTENIENWLEIFSRLNRDLSRKLCKISISFCAPVFFPLSLAPSEPERNWAAGMSCCDASLHFTYLHFIKLSHAHHLQLHYNDPKKINGARGQKSGKERDGCGWKVKVDRFELDFFSLHHLIHFICCSHAV